MVFEDFVVQVKIVILLVDNIKLCNISKLDKNFIVIND